MPTAGQHVVKTMKLKNNKMKGGIDNKNNAKK